MKFINEFGSMDKSFIATITVFSKEPFQVIGLEWLEPVGFG